MAKGYKEVEGDLIKLFQEGQLDVIVHGCNCQNTMGAGIAKTLSEAYPDLLTIDKQYMIPVGDIHRLGNFTKLTIRNGDPNKVQWIINAYTQYNPGKDLDYNALELILKKINFLFKGERIGLPGFIGAGIAGGNANVIRKIIQRQLKDCDVTVVFLPQNSHMMLGEFK